MTLPAELRAEADRVVVPHRDAQGRATSAHQAHSFEVRALLHRAADALEAGTVVRDVTGKHGYLGRNVRITLMEDDRA